MVRKYTARPNPDVWRTERVAVSVSFDNGDIRLELWEKDGDQVWVLVADDGRTETHAAITDEMFALLFRVMDDG